MLYEIIRPLTCNFGEIEKYVPRQGRILDVGCGHGILAKLLANKSKDRVVLGIDPSPEKIKATKKDIKLKNLAFKTAHLIDEKQKFDCIVIVDVLYLFPEEEKVKILKKAKSLLDKSGKLILVENGDGDELIFKMLRIQETLMTKLFKYTHSEFGGLHFLDERGYRRILVKLGFTVDVEKNLKSILPYPHFLIAALRS